MKDLITRRSIRKYDENHKISTQTLESILADTLRAPSSMNLQPVRFFVIESKEAKEKLQTVLFGNQLQNETSSAMILLAVDRQKFDNAPRIFEEAVSKGLMPKSVMDQQLQMIEGIKSTISQSDLDQNNIFDAGLMAMQLMHVARSYGYDTCPIGGFDKTRINNVLGIDENRYLPTLILSIGKADEKGYESIRLSVDEVTTLL